MRDGLPPLPEPARERWQPLRLGLVELYHYDCEEFRFEDGHLLLRGNNGTGKSKVLSLTLPFLLDGSTSSSRVEPDGDRAKHMIWNLLGADGDRRTGYAWIEFGCRNGERVQTLTLGCGLSAVRGRSRLDVWYFITERRIGDDLWLISPERVVLARERLREALGERGQIFETVGRYREAVDQRLFGLGTARYAALMDTLIQLRQPQLSKRPDESALSEALTEALPPLPHALLEDVASAMTQLDGYREELERIESLRAAIDQFASRYRHYAQVKTRREARELRQAETGFDNASRELRGEREAFDAAGQDSAACRDRHLETEQALRRNRAALEEIASDPLMTDARRLSDLQRAAEDQRRETDRAERDAGQAQERVRHEAEQTARRGRELEGIATTRDRAARRYAQTARAATLPGAVLDEADVAARRREGEDAIRTRQLHCEQLRRRYKARDAAHTVVERRGLARDQARAAEDSAAQAHATAEQTLEITREALHRQWRDCLGRAQHLQLDEPEAALAQLELWSESLSGENPAAAAWWRAYQAAVHALSGERAVLDAQREVLRSEDTTLAAEQVQLEAGQDRAPTLPHTRDAASRADRAGAPLWQLVDFREAVTPAQRAGLEAALEASGLLDAWLDPEGLWIDTDDDWLLPRRPQPRSLLDWLRPESGVAVAASRIEAVLAGIACSDQDGDAEAEAWVSTGGRYRLGPRQGAWHKTEAAYVGAASRAAARQRRLQEIAWQRADIAARLHALADQSARLHAHAAVLDTEQAAAPSEGALRDAHAQLAQAGHRRRETQAALAEAQRLWDEAEQVLQQAQRELRADAEDLQLPAETEALEAIESALHEARAALVEWIHALEAERRAHQEWQAQRQREDEARQRLEDLQALLAQRQDLRLEAEARLEELRATKGLAIAELQQRLHALRRAVETGEAAEKTAGKALREAEVAEAALKERAEAAARRRDEAEAARSRAVERLRQFAASGLFALALPDLVLPEDGAWTVDPALNAARRAEQQLAAARDDEAAWDAVQKQVSQDYTALGEALTRLGQHAVAETSDFGLLVHIVYGSRPRPIDELERELAGDVAQRREILTAEERRLLENHLQSEIAVVLQKLMREAEARVAGINTELEKRPTSTGVRFKLDWQPLEEDADGAPVGLAVARRQLLRQAAEAWAPEDRRLLGEFLQQRIDQERSRNAEGSRADQLARALDYRRWHRFRVLRWQEGAWRKLSGPASSGERALGLTVPLFAAASSHYASARLPGPRLVLLDEAFAGIDDAARAHCMALIREFDLDFVMTSEREWGCYADLPGVAIAQLQRQPGVDAVHVSRWTWNGIEKRAEPDPTQRYAVVADDGG